MRVLRKQYRTVQQISTSVYAHKLSMAASLRHAWCLTRGGAVHTELQPGRHSMSR